METEIFKQLIDHIREEIKSRGYEVDGCPCKIGEKIEYDDLSFDIYINGQNSFHLFWDEFESGLYLMNTDDRHYGLPNTSKIDICDPNFIDTIVSVIKPNPDVLDNKLEELEALEEMESEKEIKSILEEIYKLEGYYEQDS